MSRPSTPPPPTRVFSWFILLSPYSPLDIPRPASYDLRALRRPGLADGLVEPHLVAKRIHDLEGPVAPPLHGQRVRDLHAFLLEFLVVGRDVGDFQVDLHRLLPTACLRRRLVVVGSG